MSKKSYDFCGWVTKNDIRCTDGVVIKQYAFKDSKEKVPLVWNHDYNSVNNVLGHMILEHRDEGTFGYGYFNNSDEAQNAKIMVQNGDITDLSIGAKNIKRNGAMVTHGNIYEVSLVLAGANAGARIESVINHGEDGEEEGIYYPELSILLHSEDDENYYEDKKEEDKELPKQFNSIDEFMSSLTDDQANFLDQILSEIEDDEGDGGVKHNAFEKEDEVLKHTDYGVTFEELMEEAQKFKTSLKETALKHGVTNIEFLFPEAKLVDEPYVYKNQHTATEEIIEGVRKSPFAKVKSMFFDITADEARAKGYIKGKKKVEEVIKLLKRETHPQMIYKTQKFDREDLIDMENTPEFLRFINSEMTMMLKEELARAILTGDGRELTDQFKIKEDCIRPITKDDEFYAPIYSYENPEDLVDVCLKAMVDYQGSGSPTLFIHPSLLYSLKTIKDKNGRYIYNTDAEIASRMGVSKIKECSFLDTEKCKFKAVVVNLNDYVLGANKGGEITHFEDFDIDYNKNTYLVETRVSGSLVKPKSALCFYLKTDEEKAKEQSVDEKSTITGV